MLSSPSLGECIFATSGTPYQFDVRAAQDPHATLRVAGLFAQRGLTPDVLHSQKTGDDLVMQVRVHLEDATVAQILLEKIRSLVLVYHAHVMERPS